MQASIGPLKCKRKVLFDLAWQRLLNQVGTGFDSNAMYKIFPFTGISKPDVPNFAGCTVFIVQRTAFCHWASAAYSVRVSLCPFISTNSGLVPGGFIELSPTAIFKRSSALMGGWLWLLAGVLGFSDAPLACVRHSWYIASKYLTSCHESCSFRPVVSLHFQTARNGSHLRIKKNSYLLDTGTGSLPSRRFL